MLPFVFSLWPLLPALIFLGIFMLTFNSRPTHSVRPGQHISQAIEEDALEFENATEQDTVANESKNAEVEMMQSGSSEPKYCCVVDSLHSPGFYDGVDYEDVVYKVESEPGYTSKIYSADLPFLYGDDRPKPNLSANWLERKMTEHCQLWTCKYEVDESQNCNDSWPDIAFKELNPKKDECYKTMCNDDKLRKVIDLQAQKAYKEVGTVNQSKFKERCTELQLDLEKIDMEEVPSVNRNGGYERCCDAIPGLSVGRWCFQRPDDNLTKTKKEFAEKKLELQKLMQCADFGWKENPRRDEVFECCELLVKENLGVSQAECDRLGKLYDLIYDWGNCWHLSP